MASFRRKNSALYCRSSTRSAGTTTALRRFFCAADVSGDERIDFRGFVTWLVGAEDGWDEDRATLRSKISEPGGLPKVTKACLAERALADTTAALNAKRKEIHAATDAGAYAKIEALAAEAPILEKKLAECKKQVEELKQEASQSNDCNKTTASITKDRGNEANAVSTSMTPVSYVVTTDTSDPQEGSFKRAQREQFHFLHGAIVGSPVEYWATYSSGYSSSGLSIAKLDLADGILTQIDTVPVGKALRIKWHRRVVKEGADLKQASAASLLGCYPHQSKLYDGKPEAPQKELRDALDAQAQG